MGKATAGNWNRYRTLQHNYGVRECPDCGGNLVLYAGEYSHEDDIYFECCKCGFQDEISGGEV